MQPESKAVNKDLYPRILIVDDVESIHEDYRKILEPPKRDEAELGKLESELFGSEYQSEDGQEHTPPHCYRIDSAMQGRVGCQMVARAVAEGEPYQVAFIDMRMPPGWDGLQTIKKIWSIDSEIQIVLCTAYSDYSHAQIIEELGSTDQLLILKKPFEAIEVAQAAATLTTKWKTQFALKQHIAGLNQQVEKKSTALKSAYDELKDEIMSRDRAEYRLHAMVHNPGLQGENGIAFLNALHEDMDRLLKRFELLDEGYRAQSLLMGRYDEYLDKNDAAAHEHVAELQALRPDFLVAISEQSLWRQHYTEAETVVKTMSGRVTNLKELFWRTDEPEQWFSIREVWQRAIAATQHVWAPVLTFECSEQTASADMKLLGKIGHTASAFALMIESLTHNIDDTHDTLAIVKSEWCNLPDSYQLRLKTTGFVSPKNYDTRLIEEANSMLMQDYEGNIRVGHDRLELCIETGTLLSSMAKAS